MGEIRQNKITKKWVIFAPGRGERPYGFQKETRDCKKGSIYDERCPFCPGNEGMLPSITTELVMSGESRWQIRVVPNRYPALEPDKKKTQKIEGIYLTMGNYGFHEVIIESPCHNTDIIDMSIEEIELIIGSYCRRYLELIVKDEIKMILIFRNHGVQAGTSLVHPHSQLIALVFIPEYIQNIQYGAKNYYDENKSCMFCEMVRFEGEVKKRIVLENRSFLCFVPFAAEVPFEVWIVPKRHSSSLMSISGAEKTDLAAALKDILTRIHARLNDPDYNFILYSFENDLGGGAYLHWYIQIRPRLTITGGFEIGSGTFINPSLPEMDCDFLSGK